MLKQALEYLKQGYSVIPLSKRSKIPAVEWKLYQSRKPTVDEVVKWFEGRELNIGIVTGHVSKLVVIDIDIDKGGKPLEMIDRFPTDMICKTGKGYHLYYTHPGWVVENHVELLTGVDVRADGGYVVAPPSVHPNGAIYSWVDAIPR